MNKLAYTKVAKIINEYLERYKDSKYELAPAVAVVNTALVDPQYCDKWSLAINDDLYDFLKLDKNLQELFYDKLYNVDSQTRVYLEPYNGTYWNLARY